MTEATGGTDGLADLAAGLRAYLDVGALADGLAGLLVSALPGSLVRVERAPTVRERLARRPGDVRRLVVTAGERELALDVDGDGRARTTIGHTVRGVMLARTPVSVQAWLDELAVVLRRVAADDLAAREALERMLFTQ